MTGDEAAGEKAFLKSAQGRPSRPAPASPATCPACPRRRATGRPSPSGSRTASGWSGPATWPPSMPRWMSLDEAEQAVRAIYHGQGWRVNAERYMQLPSWLACLPMASAGGLDADLERMGRMKTLLTSSAVNLAPLHGEWRGQPMNPDNPPALFLIGRRGQPACWSPFANEAGNYNVAVTGKSGSGKSVLMQELVTGPDRRRRRGRGDRRRTLVPAHGRSARRRVHRLRQGPGLPQPLRHDRRRDRQPRRRLPRGVLRHAGRRDRAHGPAPGRGSTTSRRR